MTPQEPTVALSNLCVCKNPDCKIPYGYCHCGCGEKTNVAKQTRGNRGLIIGQPQRCKLHHIPNENRRKHTFKTEWPDGLCVCGDVNCKIEYGTCHCGCGHKTPICRHTVQKSKSKRGWPSLYFGGHHSGRKPLLRPISGMCVCGKMNCPVPHGTCHCGCGRETTFAKESRPKQNVYAGEFYSYIHGHNRYSEPPQFPKRCKSCGTYESDKFIRSLCAVCYDKAYAKANRTKINDYNLNWCRSHPDKIREQYVRQRSKRPIAGLIRCCKGKCKRREIAFNITEEEFYPLPTHCPVLGIELNYMSTKLGDSSPSLDRLVPSLGYVSGNVKLISMKANRLKAHGTVEELRLVLKYMEENIHGL